MAKNQISGSKIVFLEHPEHALFNNLSGQTFSRWLVLGLYEKRGSHYFWACRCDCGAVKSIRGSVLVSKNSLSCGCYQSEKMVKRFEENQAAVENLTDVNKNKEGRRRCAEYNAYYGAKKRCNNLFDKSYPSYGGRGIKFNFKSLEDFINEIGRRPSPDYSLDRIDVNGNYEAGNVRWATLATQADNKRNTTLISINNITKSQTEWSKISNIKVLTIAARRRRGWCDECAVFQPKKGECSHHKRVRYLIDLAGKQFGRLTVISYYGKRGKNKHGQWNCQCICGNKTVVESGSLKKGDTVSCGCYAQEKYGRHSITHNNSKTVEYRIYQSAKTRCCNPKTPNYLGGKIKFLFSSFEDFLNEVGRRPSMRHRLDRIDKNKSYETGNLQWII